MLEQNWKQEHLTYIWRGNNFCYYLWKCPSLEFSDGSDLADMQDCRRVLLVQVKWTWLGTSLYPHYLYTDYVWLVGKGTLVHLVAVPPDMPNIIM